MVLWPSQCYFESAVMEIHEAKGLWSDTLDYLERAANHLKKKKKGASIRLSYLLCYAPEIK